MPGTPGGRKLNLRLYVEGQRTPIKGIRLSASENQHIQATITIPPSPLAKNLKPRTLIHVFVKLSVDSAYVLLFEGEYVAYRDSEETGSKTFDLMCVGLTNFWETTYQFFINGLSPASVGAYEIATFVSGGTSDRTLSSVNISMSKDVFGSYVTQAMLATGNDIQRAMLDVLHLMVNMSGGQNGDVRNPRINTQIEKAFVNLRLGERVFVLPDNEIKSLINANNAKALLNQIAVASLNDFSTVSQVISVFLNFVNYTWVPIVSPSFTARNPISATNSLDSVRPVKVGEGSTSSARATTSSVLQLVKGAAGNTGASVAEVTSASARASISDANVQRDIVFKPNTYFAPAPTCNLVFPCMFDRMASGRFFLQEPTRMKLRTQPLPASTSSSSEFNTFSYYAPAEVEQALKNERNTSPLDSGPAITLDTKPKTTTTAPRVYRHETLVVQAGVGSIDETLTGVVPAFEELGFAEYSALNLAASDVVQGSVVIRTQAEEDALNKEIRKREELARGTNTPIAEPVNPDLHVYLANLAQYKLDLSRSKTRTVEGVSGPYNPYLALGFPAVLFARSGIYAGSVVSLNHSVDASGSAITTFTLGLVRDISVVPGILLANKFEMVALETALLAMAKTESNARAANPGTTPALPTLDGFKSLVASTAKELAKSQGVKYFLGQERVNLLCDGFDPVDHAPLVPSWLNDSYRPENIGKDVYPLLFGKRDKDKKVESILEAAGMGGSVNQVLAANILFIRYMISGNHLEFTDRLVKRDIATARQVMAEFLGAGAPDERPADSSKGMHQEDLASKMVFGEITTSTKANVQEVIVDPYLPFQKKRVTPAREYVKFLANSGSRGFRG